MRYLSPGAFVGQACINLERNGSLGTLGGTLLGIFKFPVFEGTGKLRSGSVKPGMRRATTLDM
jgi:hypothetical protein